MFCYKCGNQLPDEAVFCNKCGTKIFSGKAQQQNADVTNAGVETKNTAAEPTEKKEASNAVPQTQPSMQHTAVALAEKEEPNPTSTLPTQSSVMSAQTQNKSELQYQNNQNDFKQFVENYISRNTGYHSTEELFNSKISLRFAWLSYGIPFLLIVILGIVRSMNIGQVLLLAVLVSLIVGFCVSQLMASFRRNRLSMRSEVIFEEDINIDDFKDFLNQNLHTQYSLFHQWERLTWTGGMNANTLNELENKYKQITLGAEFGYHSIILLAKATIGPYQLNLQSGKKSFSFSVTNIVAGWADLSFKKYIWSFKIIPVMQAAAEYYLKSRQISSCSNNSVGQAPQAEYVVSTQQVSSVSDSNISVAPAMAEVPTVKKKSKAPLIIAVAAILIVTAVAAGVIGFGKLNSDDGKSDIPFKDVTHTTAEKDDLVSKTDSADTITTELENSLKSESDLKPTEESNVKVTILGETYDVQSTTTLRICEQNISTEDAENIGKLVNLIELDFTWCKIYDITPFANLSNLTKLSLNASYAGDITPLSSLTNLTHLYLSYNKTIDITPLANLTNLTNLGLTYCEICDITPLTNLTNLTALSLGNNKIRDITPLANLTNLTNLGLYSNEISDISTLANLTNLTLLYLFDNSIIDITPLSNLTNLTLLQLDENEISDITPLSNLINLTFLTLSGTNINDISPLANLTGLATLKLSNTSISDISPLANLTDLTSLSLFDTNVSYEDEQQLKSQLPDCDID